MSVLDFLKGTTTVTQNIATLGDPEDKAKPSSTVSVRREVIVNEDATTTIQSVVVALSLYDGNGTTSSVTLAPDVAADFADALDQASAIVRDEVSA